MLEVCQRAAGGRLRVLRARFSALVARELHDACECVIVVVIVVVVGLVILVMMLELITVMVARELHDACGCV